ncbi:MAG: MBL fold metallo-hydrolase [Spirochaetaceae bacterium]|nr:MBL fold metallo-hydrolase [Spirochaetaceae bacterium]
MKEVIKINENTWRIEDGMVRFYLLCGNEKATLIDTGINCPDAKQTAQELTDLPLILINTHADRDHISGNSAFSDFYMSPNEEENLHAHNAQGKILPIHEGDIIDLGGRELLIIDIPGHTPGSVGIIDKNNRVLISGDSVQDGIIFMFGPGRNLTQYIQSLKHLSQFEDQFNDIYPMHGTFPVHKDLIPKLIQGAQAILDGDAQEYAQPVNVFGNDVTLYKFDYAGFLYQK